MKNEIIYKDYNNFSVKGIIKDDYLNLDKEKIKDFFPYAVKELNEIFEKYLKALSDDRKISGEERINIITELDDFFNFLIVLIDNIYNVPEKIYDIDLIGLNFKIKITISKNMWFATGIYPDNFLKATDSFKTFYSSKLVPEFKNLIILFNENSLNDDLTIKKSEINKINLSISRLLYYILKIRFQIEKCMINK